VKTKKTDAPTEFKLTVSGGRRVEEELILEIRALARRCGLEVQSVQIVPQPRRAAARSARNKSTRSKSTGKKA
jgi:hypothetical protein